MTQTKRAASYLLLLVSILAVSTAAILIRLVNDQASALVIAVYRLGLSTVLSGLLYLTASANHRALTKRNFLWMALSGAFLAAHFVAWISSLEFISVSSSVILVTTTPLWVALLSPVLLKEKVHKRFYAGMAAAILGGCIIAVGSSCTISAAGLACTEQIFGGDPQTLKGMFLALLGAWMASGYMLIGRKIRAETDNAQYTLVSLRLRCSNLVFHGNFSR